jgi:quinol monooxygenase YgiN
MEKLKIVANIVIKNEYKEDILKALHAVTDGTRKEEGNISYVLHQDIYNSLAFIILEEWKSEDAIQFHQQTPHYLTFKEELKGKIESLNTNVIREIY